MRTCIHCHEQKPDDRFTPYENYKNVCRECYRRDCAERQKSEKGKAYIKVYGLQRRLKFKHKEQARIAAREAVKKGLLVKPTACDNCGQEKPLQGHHEDYDKPLVVMWLCVLCHQHRHGRLKDKELIKLTAPKESVDAG